MVSHTPFEFVNALNIYFLALTLSYMIFFQDKQAKFKDNKVIVFSIILNIIMCLLPILIMQFK